MGARKRAFTLIELLVAIAIVGILAVVVFQDLRQSQIKAYDGNLKSSVRGYRQALDLYQSQYKTFFVYDHTATGGCTLATPPAKTVANAGQYRLGASGSGCVGYKGGGMGRMTRRSITASDGSVAYGSTSIADALVTEGFLNKVETYPDVKDFTSSAPLAGRNSNDFILTLCDDRGEQAVSKETATNFAIFAELKQAPASVDKTRANSLCGAKNTAGGWNVFGDN